MWWINQKFRYESDSDLKIMQLIHKKLWMKSSFFWAETFETNLNKGQYKPHFVLKIRWRFQRKPSIFSTFYATICDGCKLKNDWHWINATQIQK